MAINLRKFRQIYSSYFFENLWLYIQNKYFNEFLQFENVCLGTKIVINSSRPSDPYMYMRQ